VKCFDSQIRNRTLSAKRFDTQIRLDTRREAPMRRNKKLTLGMLKRVSSQQASPVKRPPRLKNFLDLKKLTFWGRAAHRMLSLRHELFAWHARSHDPQNATARTLMRTLGKILRRASTPCDNHIQRENFRASSAPPRLKNFLDRRESCRPLRLLSRFQSRLTIALVCAQDISMTFRHAR
jgi:hypothetical protein